MAIGRMLSYDAETFFIHVNEIIRCIAATIQFAPKTRQFKTQLDSGMLIWTR